MIRNKSCMRVVIVCIVLGTIICTSAHAGHVEGSSLDLVRRQCSQKLDFKTIDEFRKFMRIFKDVTDDSLASDNKHDEPVRKCLEDREALVALEELVDNYDRKRPCKYAEVGKLEQYARKFLLDYKRRPLSMKFFTLFGVNIGLRCKLNLLAHVKQADSEADQLDFVYTIASPTGWNVLINEHTKKSLKFGTSSYASNNVINRIAKLIPGLVQIEQLDYLSFDHARNENRPADWTGVEEELYDTKDADVAAKIEEFLTQIIESCKNLDQFYVNSVLSLARLNELGLVVTMDTVNELHEHSMLLHKWLAATSFCQLMTRVRVARPAAPAAAAAATQIELRILHDDKLLDSRAKLYSYVAEFDEITDEARKNVWLASVGEAAWRHRDHAMFKPAHQKDAAGASVAIKQLKQFVRGLEHDYESAKQKQLDQAAEAQQQ